MSGSQLQARLPDLMVLSAELAALLEHTNRGIITLDMPPPDLIIEVVSPGKFNEDRDYHLKRAEYAARGVPEYWVIDLVKQRVTVFTLEAGSYREAVYTGEMKIKSQFKVLELTVEQIFKRRK